MDGLQRLEYRGYDSAGIVVLEDGVFRSKKTVGKVKELGALLKGQVFTGQARPTEWSFGQVGIG
ncbi:MAG: hypothetical protein AAB038_03725, partial [Planctomycetota bacterium]